MNASKEMERISNELLRREDVYQVIRKAMEEWDSADKRGASHACAALIARLSLLKPA